MARSARTISECCFCTRNQAVITTGIRKIMPNSIRIFKSERPRCCVARACLFERPVTVSERPATVSRPPQPALPDSAIIFLCAFGRPVIVVLPSSCHAHTNIQKGGIPDQICHVNFPILSPFMVAYDPGNPQLIGIRMRHRPELVGVAQPDYFAYQEPHVQTKTRSAHQKCAFRR